MKFKPIALGLIVALVISAGVMVGKLVEAKEPKIETLTKAEPTRSKIVAKRELPAFTLLTDKDIELRKGSIDLDQLQVADFTNRYLLTSIKRGGEVKAENLAAAAATEVLNDATAFSIPASSTTALGGQLRAGDVIELFAVHSNGNTAPTKENGAVQKFDRLVVLNIVPANKETNTPGAIALAVPTWQHDSLAAAAGGTQLLVTKKIDVQKR
jgi:hypothetical protein